MNSALAESLPTSGHPPPVYVQGGITYRPATLADDGEVRAVLRENPMDGWVRLTFERDPSLAAGENLLGESATYVARDNNGQVVGTYAFARVPTHVNGRPMRVGYLSGLRMRPEHRHRFRVLKGGYASVPVLVPGGVAPFCFTSIGLDNASARRVLEAGLPGMPVYRPVGELETYLLRTGGRPKGFLRSATSADIPELTRFHNDQAARFQFSPILSEHWLSGLDGSKGLNLSDFLLLKDNREGIQACLAIWDQRVFKRARVNCYRFPINVVRPLVNTWAAFRGMPAFPIPGRPVDQVHIAFFQSKRLEVPEMAELIKEALALASRRNASTGVLALSPGNPLATSPWLMSHAIVYRTLIETVHWAAGSAFPLDSRPVQPEAALL